MTVTGVMTRDQVEHNRNMAKALHGNSAFKKLLEDTDALIETMTEEMIEELDKEKRDELCAEIRGAKKVLSHMKRRVLNSI